MGLNIGGITGSLASLRSLPEFGQVRLGARREPVSLPGSQGTDSGRGPFFRGEQSQPPNVGFGQGLSPQGAALRTLNTTIEQTRQTIPTIEEIRERFIIASSARRDEVQRARIERTERSLTRRVESRIPEASPQARNFVSGLDEAAGQAQIRLEGAQAAAQAETQTQADAVAAPDAASAADAVLAAAPDTGRTAGAEPAGPTNQTSGPPFDFGTSENEVHLDVRV